MHFLTQIALDAQRIANEGKEFAEVRKVEGVDVSCIMHQRDVAADPTLDQFQSEPVRARDAVLIIDQKAIGRPVPGSILTIDDDAWQVINCRFMGRGLCRLSLTLWEG